MKKSILLLLAIVLIAASVFGGGCEQMDKLFNKHLNVQCAAQFRMSSDPASEAIGFTVKNRQTVYLYITLSIINDTSREAMIPIELLIANEFETIDSEHIGGDSVLSDRQEIEYNGIKHWQYKGQTIVGKKSKADRTFIVSFKANTMKDANNQVVEEDYASYITIRYNTDPNISPEIVNYSDYAQKVIVQYDALQPLSKPSAVEVKGEIISWSPIASAEGYYIGLDGKDLKRYQTNFYDTSGLAAGKHEIRFCAIGDGVNFMDSDYFVLAFTKLPRIVAQIELQADETLSKRIINWEGIPGYDDYELYDVNGNKLVEVAGKTQFDLALLTLPSGVNKIFVQPKVVSGDVIISKSINPVQVTKLEAPTIEIAGQVKWQPIDGAQYYDVFVGGVLYKRVTGETVCRIPQTYGKTVYVVAGSDILNVIPSEISNQLVSNIG